MALHGGRTKDGGYIVGDSVFYADLANTSPDDSVPSDANRVDLLDYELRVRLWLAWCHAFLIQKNHNNLTYDLSIYVS